MSDTLTPPNVLLEMALDAIADETMLPVLTPPNVLLEMALDAIADETMLPVLGDLIQELRWYDERVITICLLPADKPGRRLSAGVRQKRRAVKSRVVLEGPMTFHRLSAAPTSALARAVAAVLIFSAWPTRPFGSLSRVWRARSTWPVAEIESVRNTALVTMRPVATRVPR